MKLVVKQLPLLLGVLLLAAPESRSQGTLVFNNRVPEVGLDAPILIFPGVRAEGSDYLAQVFAGPSAQQLAPIGEPLPFLTGDLAGYVDTTFGDLRVVNSVAPGQTAAVQVRAWNVADGATFAQANTENTFVGVSKTFFVTTGDANDPGSPEPYLTGLMAFGFSVATPVPEAATITLAFIGLCFLAWSILRRPARQRLNPTRGCD